MYDCLVEHCVNKYRIKGSTDCPARKQSIKAVHKYRQINFSSMQSELDNVRQSFLIWLICMKIPSYFVGYGRRDFAMIGIIFPAPFADNNKSFFPYNTANHFLRNCTSLPFHKPIKTPVSIPLFIFAEKLTYPIANIAVFIGLFFHSLLRIVDAF